MLKKSALMFFVLLFLPVPAAAFAAQQSQVNLEKPKISFVKANPNLKAFQEYIDKASPDEPYSDKHDLVGEYDPDGDGNPEMPHLLATGKSVCLLTLANAKVSEKGGRLPLDHLEVTSALVVDMNGRDTPYVLLNTAEETEQTRSYKAVDYPMELAPPVMVQLTPKNGANQPDWRNPAHFDALVTPSPESLIWQQSAEDGDLEAAGMELLEQGFQIDWRVQGGQWHLQDDSGGCLKFSFAQGEALEPQTTLRFSAPELEFGERLDKNGGLNLEGLPLEFRLRSYLIYGEKHTGAKQLLLSDWSEIVRLERK